MEKNVAIEKLKYIKPKSVFICHSNIVEIDAEKINGAIEYNNQNNLVKRGGILIKEYKQEYRTYKCLDCGMVWKESIHAPLFMTHADAVACYPQLKSCSIVK